MIIGLAAKKQAGKSSLAKFIVDLLGHMKVKEISFAQPLKEFVNKEFAIPKDNLYGSDADKNYPLMTWGEIFTGRCITAYKKRDRDLLCGREIMQIVGTDVMRLGRLDYLHRKYEEGSRFFVEKWFGKGKLPFNSIWVDLAIMEIKRLQAVNSADVVIIPDVRFHNEVDAVKEAGGKLVRLYRDTGCKDSIPHPSELQLDEMEDVDFDFIVKEEDNKNLKQLKNFAIRMLMDLELVGVPE
jgi:hypothetical protein